MELEIKKENFTNENFNPQNFLNSILKSNNDAESEIINFKLKILQREFSNELDLNTNNLLKFSKILESDIQQTNASNNMFLQNINLINKNKIDNKQLEEIEKAYKLKNKNKNLSNALSVLEKI
jgi:hypothetical protein